MKNNIASNILIVPQNQGTRNTKSTCPLILLFLSIYGHVSKNEVCYNSPNIIHITKWKP